jgi:hypothetical protein
MGRHVALRHTKQLRGKGALGESETRDHITELPTHLRKPALKLRLATYRAFGIA